MLATAALLFTVAMLTPALANAQAFVPARGQGTISFLYQNQSVQRHSLYTGEQFDVGHTRTQLGAFDLQFGVTDKFAVSVSLPYIASRFIGEGAHRAEAFGRTSALDFNGYHGTFQDFRLDMRYNAILSPNGTVVTPYVTVVTPSYNYDYFGHGAAGRRLTEVQVGSYVGYMIERWLPGLFVQARYGFGIPQSVMGVRPFRSMLDVEASYGLFGERLRVFGMVAGQVSYAGVDFHQPKIYEDMTDDQKIHHDRVARINAVNLGGGAQFDLNPTIALFGSIMHAQSMTNGHVLHYGVTVGVSLSFQRGAKTAGTLASRRDGLVKCLCQKGQ